MNWGFLTDNPNLGLKWFCQKLIHTSYDGIRPLITPEDEFKVIVDYGASYNFSQLWHNQ